MGATEKVCTVMADRLMRIDSHYSSPLNLLHCQLAGSPFLGDLSG